MLIIYSKSIVMKRFLFIFLAIVNTTFIGYAQDKIITTDGDVITAYNVDVGGTSVYYKNSEDANAGLLSISKQKIVMIKKKDGSIIKLYNDNTNTQAEPTQSQTQQKSAEEGGIQNIKFCDLSTYLQQSNKEQIGVYNQNIKPIIEKGAKGKQAKFAYMIYGVKENSVLENDDIQISIITGSFTKARSKDAYSFIANNHSYVPAVQFQIKNKTSQTIYLDLGNTFYTMMGKPICYYVPTSTTVLSSSSSGASVNMGALAGAAGIGGTIGKLANGVNVGGSTTNATTNTTFSQRIIAIPPMATKDLGAQFMYNVEGITPYSNNFVFRKSCYMGTYSAFSSYLYALHINFSKKDKEGVMKEGEHYTYSEESSPINFSFIITYSSSENCTQEKSITTHYYLKDLIGFRVNSITGTRNVSFYADYPDKIIQGVTKISDNFSESFPRK